MRTKTLLTAVAALAIGAATSMAQTYSQNVVGYVNVVIPAHGFQCINNPLDDGTNTLNDLFATQPNNSTLVWYWNGSGWQSTTKRASGFTPANSTAFVPGIGFFVQNTSANPITNTFVGTVIQGSNTDNITYPTGYTPIGYVTPVAGQLEANLNFHAVANDKVWTYDPALGWIAATRRASSWSGTYYVPGGSPATGQPVINPSQGFFIQAVSVSGGVWTNNFIVQ